VYVKTWGCSHNSSDGEYMAGLLATSGYTITGGWAPTGAGPQHIGRKGTLEVQCANT